jgi:hypothetical protein
MLSSGTSEVAMQLGSSETGVPSGVLVEEEPVPLAAHVTFDAPSSKKSKNEIGHELKDTESVYGLIHDAYTADQVVQHLSVDTVKRIAQEVKAISGPFVIKPDHVNDVVSVALHCIINGPIGMGSRRDKAPIKVLHFHIQSLRQWLTERCENRVSGIQWNKFCKQLLSRFRSLLPPPTWGLKYGNPGYWPDVETFG